MAPEVLSKGTAYDSSADWFSFGCMLYKLLKGHSPFRQHKTKDKHEIDRMTLTMVSPQSSLFSFVSTHDPPHFFLFLAFSWFALNTTRHREMVSFYSRLFIGLYQGFFFNRNFIPCFGLLNLHS